MIRLIARALVLGVVVGLAACDEDGTAPSGAETTVAVRAYIDADGSGDFTTADSALAGRTVTLTPAGGGTALQATTGEDGVALFTVTTGAYVAALQGDAPTGATLATAANLVIVAPFQGGEVAAEFRFVFFPGSVSGVVFRDDNASGSFDTGDTPAPGITVELFEGTDTSVTPLATATTDAAGAFEFTTVRPGEYTLVLSVPFPTITLVGGDTRSVTVSPGQESAVPVQFTGQLVVPIAEVKAEAIGTKVAAEGVVTVGTGPFGTRVFYVQDASSGIMAFFNPSGTAVSVNLGASVRVVGTVNQFGGELEIDSVAVSVLGTGTVPTPRALSGAQINARTFEGELARVSDAEIISVPGGTGASFNVAARDLAGTDFTIRVAGAGTGLTRSSFVVGRRYNATGILGSFSGVAQLKPRATTDLEAASAAISIAEVKARPIGTKVTAEGVVTVGTGPFGTRVFYLQDASGGIMAFFNPSGTAVTVDLGARVRAAGTVNQFGGELEIDSVAVTVLGTATVPTPRTVTAAQMIARTFEGELAKLENATVTSVPGGTGSSFNVTVTASTGESLTVRVAGSGTGLTRSSFQVGARYDFVGILGSFSATAQLKPRSTADLIQL